MPVQTKTGSVMRDQHEDLEPVNLLCRLRLDRLRAWKKRSLRAEVCVAGRIRPQAYSSWSSIFRGFLIKADVLPGKNRPPKRPTTLWIVTSYKIAGRRKRRPSLAAKIAVRHVYRGDDRHLSDELKRYVADWSGSGKTQRRALCTVVEAEPTSSRFFPVNDLTRCLSELRYMNKDGTLTDYSTRRVLRVHPEDVHLLDHHAAAVARSTVFISYKHRDFDAERGLDHPSWLPEQLAESLIGCGSFGVWLDTLCAPSQPMESSTALTREEVRLLLAEGHAQSRVLIAIATPGYGTPGTEGTNWTLDEYTGAVVEARREAPLLRFVLSGEGRCAMKPSPNDVVFWSVDIGSVIVPRLTRLLR